MTLQRRTRGRATAYPGAPRRRVGALPPPFGLRGKPNVPRSIGAKMKWREDWT